MARLIVLTDPAVTARVPATTAQRVLEKNAPTAMAFPVMDSHVRNAVIVPPMVTAPHAQIVLTAQDTQTVVSEASVQAMEIVLNVVSALLTVTALNVENVLLTVTVLSVENDLHMELVPIGESVLVMEIVKVHPVENVLPTAVVTVHHEVTVLTVQRVIAPHMVTAETVTHAQSAVVSAEAVQMELLEANVQAEIEAVSLHLETVTVVRNVPSVLVMVIVLSGENDPHMVIVVLAPIAVETVLPTATEAPVRSVLTVQVMEIVPNAETVPHMVTVVLVQIVGEIDHPTEIVQNVPVSVTVEVVQIVLVLLVVVMTALLVGKSQNLLKNSAWLANCVWFVHTTMTPGSMTMSLVMSSTRSLVMS